ncbi:helix-turn-helix domain-containing protein [Evansella halocellulosilytica]|uniref:helix-turn-helix domain-containing protein n=1 Tax=Evansella halocellulosilytica TaxID=2011013 RepID=UPI000BB9632F|nr:helix-turn-helix domain-containing protein [Evansella halocellulosilytica]
MVISSQNVFDKSERREGEFFIKLPSNLRWYIFVPGYRAEYNYLYALIVDFFSAKKGYAYPSVLRLAREYGKTEKTTSTHLRALKDAGLIDYPEDGRRYYVPLEPLSQEELFRVCPEAERNYRKALEKEAAERERSAENWLALKGYR